jgi:steroid delta-isomerase-like uncharacterized protein
VDANKTQGGATRDAVLSYLEALNAGDAGRVAGCVTADFVNDHVAVIATGLQGRDAYRERLGSFLDDFRNLRYDVEDMVVEDDRAALAYVMTADWRDAASNSHPIRIRGIFRFHVVGGSIAYRADYWDSADFLRQVGEAGG